MQPISCNWCVCCCPGRCYGGTKLGAGGLVRAYAGAARDCLRAAPKTFVKRQVSPLADHKLMTLGCMGDCLSEGVNVTVENMHDPLAAHDSTTCRSPVVDTGTALCLVLLYCSWWLSATGAAAGGGTFPGTRRCVQHAAQAWGCCRW